MSKKQNTKALFKDNYTAFSECFKLNRKQMLFQSCKCTIIYKMCHYLRIKKPYEHADP